VHTFYPLEFIIIYFKRESAFFTFFLEQLYVPEIAIFTQNAKKRLKIVILMKSCSLRHLYGFLEKNEES